MNCETFTGGYCEKTGMHVPRSWCLERCEYFGKDMPLIKRPEPKKPEPPTLIQMSEHFTKAMAKWAKSGLKTVSKEEYERRRLICSKCSGGWRCPKCGCMLWAKAALATEKCEKWE